MTDHPDVPDIDVDIPSPSGLKVTTERPYRILVIGDYCHEAGGGTLSGPMADGPVEIKAEGIGPLMAAAAPHVSLKLADPTRDGNVMTTLGVRLDALRAFEPTRLVGQIPAATRLMDVRSAVVDRLHGKSGSAQLARIVEQAKAADDQLGWLTAALKAAPAAPAADPSAVDDVMSMLDLGDAPAGEPPASKPPSKPASPVSSIVSAAAGGGGLPAGESAALRKALAELDRRISLWVTAVLHSPAVQAIESAWRSLAFLAGNIDYRKGVRLSVLQSPVTESAERFNRRVLDPVFDDDVPGPDLVVVDTQFTASAPHVELLDEFAQHGASLPAVVLAGASSEFVGAKFAWQVATLPPLVNTMDQWKFAKWKTLRQQLYARSLGVVFGKALLRQSYGAGSADGQGETRGASDFHYVEPCIGEGDFIWASGAIVAACTVARSMSGTGWPTAMSGFVNGRVDGFKTAQGGKKGEKTFGPTDTTLQLPKIQEFAAVGLNAVVGSPEQGEAVVWNGLTAARPAKVDAAGVLEVSLPYQLFAVRLSSLLLDLKPHLRGGSAEALTRVVNTHMRDWIPFEADPTPEQLCVQIRPSEADPAVLELAVTVAPPQQIVPGGVPVVLGFRLN